MNFRRVWTTAAALALLVLGMQLRDVLPNAADRAAESFDYDSSAPVIGDVDDVQVTVAETFNGTASNAAWVVVDYQFTQDQEVLLGAEIEAAGGNLYAPENTPGNACELTYPGLRSPCTLVFEMPEDEVEAATLYFYVGNRMGPRVVVQLPETQRQSRVTREAVWL
ncbi:hypothetical protein [Corynebacterium haemomassiliense]|uniref:hypothetical protein n=1 Tax=Corynebacterium haemomassiliense TaxID=2754726 RepID=UPI00288A3DFD|nr:hypothetical protein [Corynebacterium haemomassiliense]